MPLTQEEREAIQRADRELDCEEVEAAHEAEEWQQQLDIEARCITMDAKQAARYRSARRWRRAHRDDLTAYARRYREGHRDALRKYQRQYNRNHRDEVAASRRRYRRTHANALREYQRRYRQQHREAYNAYMRRYMQTYRHSRQSTDGGH